MEIEALESIFGDDFKKGNENGMITIAINLKPYDSSSSSNYNDTGDDYDAEEQKDNGNEVFVKIKLLATFPKKYPEVIPDVGHYDLFF